ncbi:PIN domain-containing protein [Persephonella sp.]|uniref:type II toxin-antitoxin system VapC family toxin n=1 Tax=Persephonella sp. TaxID=2060922 RepID=UPI0025DA04ED|nr:PIN domain-containing protein [Persephonella sp.]
MLLKVEKGEITEVLCATTITTIYYLIRKSLNKEEAKRSIDLILSLFDIAPVNRTVLETARKLNFNDFEDGVIYASAIHSNCDVLITRNVRDFKANEIPIYEPAEFLKILDLKI